MGATRPPFEDGPAGPRLRELIERRGPLSFADFMEVALYDPEVGYYAEPPIGPDGDYTTSPHVSPLFGMLLARHVAGAWAALGRPDPFGLVEIGGGDGTLAAGLLAALPADAAAAVRFVAVERSPGARRAHRQRGLHEVGELADVPPVLGSDVDAVVVMANEVLDNVPFHRLLGTPAGPVELRVALDASGGLTLVTGPVSARIPPELIPSPPVGREVVVSPAALSLAGAALAVAPRVYVLLIDYAASAARAVVHGYRDRGVTADVLSAPGARDVTAPADLAAVARHARASGARAWGPLAQRDLLLAAGYREEDGAERGRQVEALAAGRGVEATRRFTARQRASLLVDPSGLGRHRALWLGTAGLPRPRAHRPSPQVRRPSPQ